MVDPTVSLPLLLGVEEATPSQSCSPHPLLQGLWMGRTAPSSLGSASFPTGIYGVNEITPLACVEFPD